MTKRKGYGQFCPVAKAAEVVAERWTPLILRELLAGARRFSELRRGVPLCSPSLLSSRLSELEDAGVVKKITTDRGPEYVLTEAGEALGPIVDALGTWGHRHAQTRVSRDDLDPSLLMWDVRRRIDPRRWPGGRGVALFELSGVPASQRRFWLLVDGDDVDLCVKHTGRDVDLTVRAHVRTLTEVWLGHAKLEETLRTRGIALEGPREQTRAFPKWFTLSNYATTPAI